MGELNAGVMEIAGEGVDRAAGDPGVREWHTRLRDLALEMGRPITFGVFSRRAAPGVWKQYLDLLDETAAMGGRMFAQAHSRSLSALLSFKTQMPFDRLPVWKELRALPLGEQQTRLRDPELRRRLVEAARERDTKKALGTEARQAAYDWIFVMDQVDPPHRSVAEIARERGVDPVEAMIDLALEKDMDRFFFHPIANEDQELALELIKHPQAVVTFSDSGAHVSQLMDSSLQTYLLSHWVRARQALTLEQAVRMLSFVPASYWGFTDRGLIREGMAADFVVFDPDTIARGEERPAFDMPGDGMRYVREAHGIDTVLVNGEVAYSGGAYKASRSGVVCV
jgi:N-acyl-D-aspartate/D-glutamate deacylase